MIGCDGEGDEDDKTKREVGVPRVRQCHVVGDQWRRVDDDDGHQQGVVLGLEHQKRDGQHVEHHQHAIKHAGACLVVVALVQVVDDADDCQ